MPPPPIPDPVPSTTFLAMLFAFTIETEPSASTMPPPNRVVRLPMMLLCEMVGREWPKTAMPPPLPLPGQAAEVRAELPVIELPVMPGVLPVVSTSMPPP